MTREEAIKILRDTPIDIRSTREDDIHTLYATAQNMAIEALQQTAWIPVGEELPSEKDGQVLVTKRGEVRIATYSEFSGTWYVGEMCAVGGEDPIAWMPLPTPYKGGDDE